MALRKGSVLLLLALFSIFMFVACSNESALEEEGESGKTKITMMTKLHTAEVPDDKLLKLVFGVIVGIEGGINHPVHSPQVMKRLLDSIDSNNLQVIFDPANFMDMDNYQRQEEVFEEAMELFGDRIVIVHAKDFIIENNWIKMVPVGTGMLNYDAIFKLLKQRKPHIHVLLENTREPYIDQSIKFLRKKYAEA